MLAGSWISLAADVIAIERAVRFETRVPAPVASIRAGLRTLEERLRYLRDLEERRTAILDSIREQGKLMTRSKR